MDAAAMTGRAALCFSDGGVWAGYAAQEAVLPRFLPVAAGGADSLSPLMFADAPRVAAGGVGYPTATALRTLLAGLVDQLDVPRPVGRLTCGYPAHWGSSRRAVLRAAMRDVAREVELVPTATALAQAGSPPDPVLVVECGELISLASVVNTAGEIVACEFAAAGTADGAAGVDTIVQAAAAAAAGQQPTLVLLAANTDQDTLLEALGAEFPASHTRTADWPGAIAGLLAEADTAAASLPQATSVPPWPVQRRRPKRTLTAVAAVTALTGVAVAGTLWAQRSATQRAASVASAPPASAPRTGPAPHPATKVGDLLAFPPAGWVRADGSLQAGTWTEFSAPDGRKIMLQVNPLNPGTTYGALADGLAEEIRTRPGKYVELNRDAVAGGRRGVGYREIVGTKREARWHVIIEQRTQLSIGCGYAAGRWESIASECADFIRTLQAPP